MVLKIPILKPILKLGNVYVIVDRIPTVTTVEVINNTLGNVLIDVVVRENATGYSGIITGVLGYNDNLLLGVAASAYINGLAGEMAEMDNSSITMTSRDTVNNIKKAINTIINDIKEEI